MSKEYFPPHAAARDYEAKTYYETARLARQATRAGLPPPFGDPLSGVVIAAEPAAGPLGTRMVDALQRSLVTVKLDRAYVTWSHPDILEEILSLEPTALVAVGSTTARTIDSCDYTLAKERFSEVPEGSWFAWTESAYGLRLPALAPALDDASAKRRFWTAFLALRALVTGDGT